MAAQEDGCEVTAISPALLALVSPDRHAEIQYLLKAGWSHSTTMEEDGLDSWGLPDEARKTMPDFVSRMQRYWDHAEAVALQQRLDRLYAAEECVTKQKQDQIPDLVSPWVPMNKAIDLKHLGKLLEELGEATSIVSRCLIQGIDEKQPVTGKLNRDALEEELADVEANIELVRRHFMLDVRQHRRERKIAQLSAWHSMLEEPVGESKEFICGAHALFTETQFVVACDRYRQTYTKSPTDLIIPFAFLQLVCKWAAADVRGTDVEHAQATAAYLQRKYQIKLVVRHQSDRVTYAILR